MTNNTTQAFRAALINYLKKPDDATKKNNLLLASKNIFDEVTDEHGMDPDNYWPILDERVRQAVQGIKLSPSSAKKLDLLLRDLGNPDTSIATETSAFHALCFAFHFRRPDCLKETVKSLLSLENSLNKEQERVNGSIFVKNSGVTKIKAKKAIISDLLKPVCQGIFNKTKVKKLHTYLPVSFSLEQKIALMEEHIDSLSTKDRKEILTNLSEKIKPILKAHHDATKETNPTNSNYPKLMSNVQKQRRLMFHSFHDKTNFLWDFLAWIQTTILNAVGAKTPTIKLLENTNDEIKSSLKIK